MSKPKQYVVGAALQDQRGLEAAPPPLERAPQGGGHLPPLRSMELDRKVVEPKGSSASNQPESSTLEALESEQ